MQMISVSILPLLAAAAIRFVAGALWYSPIAFSAAWCSAVGMSEAQMKAGLPKGIAVELIGSLVMAFVLTYAVGYAGASSLVAGALVGFWIWLGFIAVVILSATAYEQRPLKLFFINGGFNLVALLLMGALLAVWH